MIRTLWLRLRLRWRRWFDDYEKWLNSEEDYG